MAPSKFWALSSNTAVCAFCKARDSIVFLSFSRFSFTGSFSESLSLSKSLVESMLAFPLIVSWLPLLRVVSELAFRFCNLLRSFGSDGSSLRGERGDEVCRGLENVLELLRLAFLGAK